MYMNKLYVRTIDDVLKPKLSDDDIEKLDYYGLVQEDENHDIYKFLLLGGYKEGQPWNFSQYETDRYYWGEDFDIEITREQAEKILKHLNYPVSILDLPLDKEKNKIVSVPYETGIFEF